MREALEEWSGRVAAVVLVAAAMALILAAFQERTKADFLAGLGRIPGVERDTGSGPYYVAFWFDIGAALALAAGAATIRWAGGRIGFSLGLLLTLFTPGSGLLALLTTRPEVRTTLPLPVVEALIAGFGALGVIASLTGFMISPALPPRAPTKPPVPPSHQAG